MVVGMGSFELFAGSEEWGSATALVSGKLGSVSSGSSVLPACILVPVIDGAIKVLLMSSSPHDGQETRPISFCSSNALELENQPSNTWSFVHLNVYLITVSFSILRLLKQTYQILGHGSKLVSFFLLGRPLIDRCRRR